LGALLGAFCLGLLEYLYFKQAVLYWIELGSPFSSFSKRLNSFKTVLKPASLLVFLCPVFPVVPALGIDLRF
jgi:hypothetical protein|tara:strand:+ start:3616 stop:3831 length:216 start_codon:yes stop_codon:yes gene_type:complete